MEAKQGQADNAHQRRLEVKQDGGRVDKKSTYERKVEERASTYLHWEETPSLPSPPATPPAEGQNLSELFSRISAVPKYQPKDRSTQQQQYGQAAPDTPPSLSSSNTSLASMQEVDEGKPLARGLRKSTAFHDATLLQAQLDEERRTEKEEKRRREREVEKEKEAEKEEKRRREREVEKE